jgi:Tol biopolymer transport system component
MKARTLSALRFLAVLALLVNTAATPKPHGPRQPQVDWLDRLTLGETAPPSAAVSSLHAQGLASDPEPFHGVGVDPTPNYSKPRSKSALALSRGITMRVSLPDMGSEADGESRFAAISADGRYVAFQSHAGNMVRGDEKGRTDVFVRDRLAGRTYLVSATPRGEVGNQDSDGRPAISADGRYVAFLSWASNLVPGDTNRNSDIFVHDRQSGQTARVSVSSSGQEGNARSYNPAISADGRYVAFVSHADNLVARDTNGQDDVFVHDRETGQTTRVSLAWNGAQANSWSDHPSISADGRYVAFHSRASNLVAADTNGAYMDVFVYDR